MKIVFISLAFLACVVSSCEPSSHYSRIIKNNSNYEILVIKKNYPACDTFTIGTGGEQSIYEEDRLASTKSFEDCTFKNPKSDTFLLQVKDNPSLIVNADVLSNVNWYFSDGKKSSKNHCNCRLTITDDLIQ